MKETSTGDQHRGPAPGTSTGDSIKEVDSVHPLDELQIRRSGADSAAYPAVEVPGVMS